MFYIMWKLKHLLSGTDVIDKQKLHRHKQKIKTSEGPLTEF